MGVKSIIDIDVNDSQFKRFLDYYDAYQAKLGKQAQMWASTGASTKSVAGQFQKMTAQLMAQNATKQDLENANRKQLTTLNQSDRLWTSMSRSTKSVASNIKDATLSLMKWAGVIEIVSGVLGVGGLFGINRMASDVAGMRQTARGRGVSIGEQTAFKNFSQLGLDASFLDTVSQIKADPSKQWTLGTLGIGNGMSTGDTSVAMLRAMRARAQGTPASQYGLLDQQTGLNVGSEVWRNIATMGDKEFNRHISDYQSDASRENIGDKTAEGWANFNRAMQRAGETLERTFVYGLTKLEGPLTNLSGAFNRLVATILGSKGVQDGIGKLAEWINEFSDAISKGTFQQSVKDFIQGVEDMANTLKIFAHPVDAIGNKFSNSLADRIGGFFAGGKSQNSTDFAGKLAAINKFYGLPDGFMETEFARQGGRFGKNPFNMSEQFARDYNFNTDNPDDEAWAVGKKFSEMARSNPKHPMGQSALMQAFDADQGIHVEVRVMRSGGTPGNSTPVSVNQLNGVPLLAGLPF